MLRVLLAYDIESLSMLGLIQATFPATAWSFIMVYKKPRKFIFIHNCFQSSVIEQYYKTPILKMFFKKQEV